MATGLSEERVPVAGLTAAAEILVDTWGVPHIYAASTRDAFAAQGFNAARDRLWQIDTWRRRGLGLLAEVFGTDYVPWDRAARLFLFRGDMHAEWLAYSAETKLIASAFTAGINAYVRRTRDDPSLLPAEFRELGYEPAFWAPEDVARIRSHGLFQNVAQEVARARVLRDFGPGAEELRRRREPAADLVIPDGLDLTVIPDDVLQTYLLATAPVPFPAPGAAAAAAAAASDPSAAGAGSNNWVLAGTRTATGRPLLANDPHRTVSVPSLRYMAHLSAPGFDVIGAGEPALPGISIGHNGHIAFGFTVFSVDQEDLYVYQTCPDAPLDYRYQDRWEPMRVIRELIPVRGGPAAEVELAFTRHGPVIRADAERHTAFAVRAAWLEPGMAPYLGSIDYMRATSWEQFSAAMNRWGAPGENQVYADVDGNIAWKAAGLTPIRPNWDGTLPVPGDGRYEWAGFYDMDQLPEEVNPDRGWIATANEMNLPAGFPPERKIGYDWPAPFRRQRINEVLEARTSLSAADLVALQEDFLSIPARQIVSGLAGVTFTDPAASAAAGLLRDWDCVLAADSAAAALFQVWYRRHLRPGLLRQALEQVLQPGQVGPALSALLPAEDLTGDARIDLQLFAALRQQSGKGGAGALAVVLETTLRAAMADLAVLLGEDRSQWAWGRLHRAHLVHPAAGLLDETTRAQVTLGPLPRGGSSDTVGATTYLPDFTQSAGASFRVVVDVGAWDNSLAMNSPGQSGDPASPHFADLFPAWAAGGAIPLLYSRERVEAATERRILLVPG